MISTANSLMAIFGYKPTTLKFEHNGQWYEIDKRGMSEDQIEKSKQGLIQGSEK